MLAHLSMFRIISKVVYSCALISVSPLLKQEKLTMTLKQVGIRVCYIHNTKSNKWLMKFNRHILEQKQSSNEIIRSLNDNGFVTQ